MREQPGDKGRVELREEAAQGRVIQVRQNVRSAIWLHPLQDRCHDRVIPALQHADGLVHVGVV